MTLRVLLIDDHHLFREGLRSVLSARGVDVVAEGSDGSEALVLTRSHRPDLVLMDLEMREIGGLVATRILKAEFPDLPVVILTASEAEDDLFEAVKSGAAGYLLKSYSADTVVDMVDGAAKGIPALTPQLASRILAEFSRLSTEAAQAAAPTGRPRRLPVQAQPAENLIEPLTAREREVLEVLMSGASNKEIAHKLVVSENTVKYHLKNILEKLHLRNRAQVVAYAMKYGLGEGQG